MRKVTKKRGDVNEEQNDRFIDLLGPGARFLLLLLFMFSGIMLFRLLSDLPGMGFLLGGPDKYSVNKLRLAQGIYETLMFAIPALLYARAFPRTRMASLGLNRSAKFPVFLFAVLALMAAIPFIIGLTDFIGHYTTPIMDKYSTSAESQEMEQHAQQMANAIFNMRSLGDLILNIVVLALIPAISEELFFRGAAQVLLKDWTRRSHAAIWFTAILFSFMHMSASGFIPRLLLGAALGYFFEWSGSLWVVIAAHFLYDASEVIIPYLEMHKYVDFGTYVLPSVAVVSAVGAGVGIWLVWRFTRRNPNYE